MSSLTLAEWNGPRRPDLVFRMKGVKKNDSKGISQFY